MKTCTALLLLLGIVMAASAQGIDRFHYFQEHGVMDPQISSQAANSLVREGIASGDPKVVDLTIRGLGKLAAVLAHDLPHAYPMLPTRTFHTVPGLKKFLIQHWRQEHEKAGFSIDEALRGSLGFHTSEGVLVKIPSPAEWGLEVTETGEPIDLEAFVAELSKRTPAWLMIRQILSVYWPGDPEVERFLYEVRDTDTSRNVALETLDLINFGKFISAAANAFRISLLDNPHAVIMAAEGLALSRPPDALPALIEAGVKHPAAQRAVMIAVAGYDESQLVLHAEQIGQLVQGGVSVTPTTAEMEAYNRLVRLSGSVTN